METIRQWEAPDLPGPGRFRSIQARLIASFSLLFVLMLAVALLTAFTGIPFLPGSGELAQHRAETFRSLNLAADLKKDRLARWLRERRDDAHALADSDLVQLNVTLLRAEVQTLRAQGGSEAGLWDRVRTRRSYRVIEEYLNVIRTAYYKVYARISIADAETGTIFVSTDPAVLGTGVSRDPAFLGALASHNDTVSDVHIDPAHGHSHFTVGHVIDDIDVASLEDKEDMPIAVLLLDVDAEPVFHSMLHAGEGLGKRDEALLVNQDVRILTALKHPLADGTWAQPLVHRIQAEPAVRAARGDEGIIETTDYRGEPVLAAYRHLRVTPEWGWGLVVKRDRSEVLAPMRRDILSTLSAGAGALLLGMGLILLLARRLTRPIRALSRTAKRVAEGDLQVRARVIGTDEIGLLAETFNDMLERIEERTNELAAVNMELEAFSYSVSHDLRTPLRGIDGFSQILLEDYAERLDEPGREALHRVRAASQRMGRLIDDLLELSQVTRADLRPVPVNLSALARDVCDDLHGASPERDVTLTIADGLWARGDSRLLRQMLVNLFENAWKFTGKHARARIEFGVTQANGRATYFLRDDGAGFDMAYSGKLFGAFQRLHTQTEFEGTGIGLATVQRIVHRHRGRVWAEAAVERGATIYFTLNS